MTKSCIVALAGLLAVPVAAQTESVVECSFGVSTTGGVVRAGGPDWSAHFTTGAVEFAPLLGRAAERPYPVRFAFADVRRGVRVVATASGVAEPAAAGDRVSYVHDGVTEVYDVRADGIEQSFVFATKPAGIGDLVVRGAITTDLPLAQASDDGVRYELPGVGGVTFGAVTGVDANGATARGAIRVAGDGASVEWVLPAAFVDGAAYPLVLDPLIGSAFTVGNVTSTPDTNPSVAYDVSNDVYMVVWRVDVSASVSEVRAQRVSGAGVLTGGQILLTANASPDVRPAVADINQANRFLVGYATRSTITQPPFGTLTFDTLYVRAVDAASAVISGSVQLAGGAFFPAPTHVSIGGDARTVFGISDEALVAFRTETGSSNEISASIVYVPPFGDPVVVSTQSIASSSNRLGGPAVTAHCGSLAEWVVVFGQSILAATGPMQRIVGQRVAAQTVSASAALCGVPFTIVGGATDVDNPTVATDDGVHFSVAWQDNPTATVRMRTGVLSGSCAAPSATLGSIVEPITTAGVHDQPALAFAADKYLLSWRHRTLSTTARIMMKGLEPSTCASCGSEWTVDSTVSAAETPAIGARYEGGASSDEALLVWSNGAIRGRRCEAHGTDVVTSMGGGCSITGFDDFATYDGDAVIGNANFQLSISNSVSLPLILVLGFGNLSAPCGSCTIVPTLDVLLPATNPFTLSMPCDPLLVGRDLYTQWVLLKPSDCPILPDLAFTNALRFTIGE